LGRLALDVRARARLVGEVYAVALTELQIERESLRLDRDKPYVEVIDGIEIMRTGGTLRHSILQGEMGGVLNASAGKRGAAAISLRVWLVIEKPVTSLVPDVAFVSWERLKRLSEALKELPRFAPDIVAEIRSPEDRERNIARKIELYLAHGSRLVLDVDPAKRKIFAHDGESVRRYGIGDTFVHDRFPDLTFDVRAFFASAEIRRR
jgi:Uma2 family endonuclease